MCISFSPPSAAKSRIIDTSYFVYEEDTSILMPYPNRKVDQIRTLVAPFQVEVNAIRCILGVVILDLFTIDMDQVWICLAWTAIVAPVVIWLFDRLSTTRNCYKKNNLIDFFFFYLELITGRGKKFHFFHIMFWSRLKNNLLYRRMFTPRPKGLAVPNDVLLHLVNDRRFDQCIPSHLHGTVNRSCVRSARQVHRGCGWQSGHQSPHHQRKQRRKLCTGEQIIFLIKT